MKIQKHHSLQVANKVLKLITVPKKVADVCHVESYSNCREQGYSIIGYPNSSKGIRVSFSECRNSDQIVVYTGSYLEFQIAGNIPSDKIWGGADYFHTPEEAARFIEKYLSSKR
jgi:hypothetical protein